MATEAAPVNGSYASEQNFNASASAAASSTSTTASGNGGSDIPKDEVGWYFVEQYYTTLSRSPEKLFLFYNKRSQFVSGTEEEKIAVCVGQKSIADRIKELDFQDCKVRITNVDSQGSDQHIVIQVIGEISNKHAPHRKFAQTFVLAAQTNGYFVLNDIFRYIADEDAEFEGDETQEEAAPSGVHEPVPTATETGEETLTNNADSGAREADAAKLDKSLEEAIEHQEAEPETSTAEEATNDDEESESASDAVAEDAPVAAPATETKPSEVAVPAAVEEDVKQPEKPKEPEPTPAATPKPSQAPPAAPSKPAAPKTWANLVASNRVALPQAPSSSKSSAPAQPQVNTPPAPAQAPATSSVPATAAPPSATPTQAPRDSSPAAQSGGDSASGWQTAGADHSKRQSRVISQPAADEATRAYIKNVFEGVSEEALKKELQKYGEVTYLDISRAKNCAFVDFATRSAFQAAVAANPHKIGDDNIFVEERRVRPQNQQFFPRGGGAPQRGRGDGRPANQGRGGFKQEGGRGGFTPRGRGGAATPRGRGANQAA